MRLLTRKEEAEITAVLWRTVEAMTRQNQLLVEMRERILRLQADLDHSEAQLAEFLAREGNPS